ncbi:threonylcarbamoyl-AMP synthase [bacterium]|nr:threonylcarbamoyl-AMP synthase [bacterium]
MSVQIEQAAEVLRSGGTVVFPTETVYGLGAHALNPTAVARVFEIKGRPRFNPLIVHLPSLAALDELAQDIPEAARVLAARFWPGPLTLVLPRRACVPDLVTAGLPTVAVRMPRHPIAQELLAAAGIPVAAPSANRFTCLSPTRLEHARSQLKDRVDFYLDGGPCEVGVESTIVGWIDGKATLLRLGGLAIAEIENAIGPLQPIPTLSRPMAPGALAKHYAPKTPLLFSKKPTVFGKNRRVALLALQPGAEDDQAYTRVAYLSPGGDLNQAAQNLFSTLAELEAQGLDLIVARPMPEQGLGPAINDRLSRAGSTLS